MYPEFIDKLFLKRRLERDEWLIFNRTVSAIQRQLLEAPFDPSLVYPSPFVIGYIHGQCDPGLLVSDYCRGLWAIAPMANLVGLKDVARWARRLNRRSGRYAERDLTTQFDEGYRAGESDFYNQQFLQYGLRVDVPVNNLVRYLANDETSYEGKWAEFPYIWALDERLEQLVQLKTENNDTVPVEVSHW